jgi:hypothetical protein
VASRRRPRPGFSGEERIGRRRQWLCLLACTASLVACEPFSGVYPIPFPGEPHPPETVIFLFVSPDYPTVAVGGETLLRVQAVSDPPGATIRVGAVTWSINKPDVAAVISPVSGCGDRCALLVGKQQGRATVQVDTTLNELPSGAATVIAVE